MKKRRSGGLPATLLDVPPGGQGRVLAFKSMPSGQRESLQAYGLVPGRWVTVIQHAPVTVIQVENTELALEAELAGLVEVDAFSDARRALGRSRRPRRRQKAILEQPHTADSLARPEQLE